MRALWRLTGYGAVAMLLGCSRLTGGAAQLPFAETPGQLRSGVDPARIMLDTPQMRGITGAGEDLSIIPSMDTASPVDIEQLTATVPAECRFLYAETAIFGTGFERFHKITFQYPDGGALISEGAAAYPDADAAQRAFDALVGTVSGCAAGSVGSALVGQWSADDRSLRTRSGRCGSDYRVASTVVLEVTFCGFPDSVSEIVLTNLAARVGG